MQLRDLTQNVSVLLEGMPKVCKLPLFDYKASGCLAFYHLRLIEVIGHRELQTNVFHSFRELGNAIVFIMLLEENMVRADTVNWPLLSVIGTSDARGGNRH